MVGICFYFEDYEVDVWSGKKLDAWNYACKIAGDIESAIVINKTDQKIESFDKSLDFKVVNSIDEIDFQGHVTELACPWVFPVEQTIPLWSFDHKTDWYVFGDAYGSENRYSSKFLPNSTVCIPQAGRGSVHSVHAATTVMFHRYWTINQ
jgi:hypothetical protein